jgi:hypothetical protein
MRTCFRVVCVVRGLKASRSVLSAARRQDVGDVNANLAPGKAVAADRKREPDEGYLDKSATVTATSATSMAATATRKTRSVRRGRCSHGSSGPNSHSPAASIKIKSKPPTNSPAAHKLQDSVDRVNRSPSKRSCNSAYAMTASTIVSATPLAVTTVRTRTLSVPCSTRVRLDWPREPDPHRTTSHFRETTKRVVGGAGTWARSGHGKDRERLGPGLRTAVPPPRASPCG